MDPHESPATERRFLFSLVLTGAIFLAELIGGWWTGSLALLSDAAHVFLDVFALGLSYGALRISARPPDNRHTFGFHRLEVLAALINGLTLGAIAVGIFSEAWERWLTPQEVKSAPMLVIAVIGLLVNLVVVFILRGEAHHHLGGGHSHNHDHAHKHEHALERVDLNVHSAFLHVVGDTVSSVGVIGAALVIGFTGWMWVDPLVSVLIGLIILLSAGRVLRSSVHILVEGVPDGLSLDAVAKTITSTPGVGEVHDLHVWNLCSGHIALSAHAVLAEPLPRDSSLILIELQRRLSKQFGIQHTTIQLESPATASDRLLDVK
jgi:cobalt-zinc-cadmium efflux system protein